MTEGDIEDLSLFRFSEHLKIAPKIEEKKTEVVKVQRGGQGAQAALAAARPRGERHLLAADLLARERGCGAAFAYVLRAVLANSPNSIPSERVFSILNDTFDEDQTRSLADYIKLSLMLQFNARSRQPS